MKKSKLESSYELDFELIGLVCNQKEYKLAWHLNHALEIDLRKMDDIRIEFADQSVILISNYLYEEEFLRFELIQNKLLPGGKHRNPLLIPELKQFDYFLKCKDQIGEYAYENVSGIIKDISIVEYMMRLNFDNLKSKENLLF
ncbi:MAG: hypothetical protein Tsb0034_27990 [Ekhidna sp.]